MIKQPLDIYKKFVVQEIKKLIDTIDYENLDDARKVISITNQNKGRLHITGIGKPSHVAEYMSALFSSIGTPCYFLDATEAVHGSSGQVVSEDTVIAISNSGNTDELCNTIENIKKIGASVIGITGNLSSVLAKISDVVLFAGVNQEGDDTNKPPRLSILAEIIVLQSLSILLQEDNNFSMEKYMLWHPGGSLGAQTRLEINLE